MTKDYHIFHSVNRWLPPTQGWITDQMELFDLAKQTVLADTFLELYPKKPKAYKAPKGIMLKLNPNFRIKRIEKTKCAKSILFSHFGNRAWHDLNVKCDRRIVRFYGYDLHRLPFENPIWDQRYQQLFEKADVIITEGPFMKSELVKKGCPVHKIQVLPFGVSKIKVLSTPNAQLQTGQIPKILIAGAFKEKKGIDTALLACKHFLTENPNQKIEIHLVGDAVNTTDNDHLFNIQLQSLFNDRLIKPMLQKHGFVSRNELQQIAAKCDFALLPSQWAADRDCEGGFPVTFLELMAAGLPIISTHHCDIPFAVNNHNGILCQERDYKAMAAAIDQMLNPDVLCTKSIAASKTVDAHFDWKKLNPLYHQVILGE
ncbi:MAG: glycosyltransferase [Bacteroidia bacterium]